MWGNDQQSSFFVGTTQPLNNPNILDDINAVSGGTVGVSVARRLAAMANGQLGLRLVCSDKPLIPATPILCVCALPAAECCGLGDAVCAAEGTQPCRQHHHLHTAGKG